MKSNNGPQIQIFINARSLFQLRLWGKTPKMRRREERWRPEHRFCRAAPFQNKKVREACTLYV